MSYPYDFHPEAEEELFKAIDYLDGQREGYGVLLAEASANILDQIIEKPKRFPIADTNSQRRRAILPKPFNKTYSIYFDFDGERILIASFFNNYRDPGIWQERK
ncbi:MAG: hypothetical protein AAF587_34460 [Bacteroidota bacterium]